MNILVSAVTWLANNAVFQFWALVFSNAPKIPDKFHKGKPLSHVTKVKIPTVYLLAWFILISLFCFKYHDLLFLCLRMNSAVPKEERVPLGQEFLCLLGRSDYVFQFSVHLDPRKNWFDVGGQRSSSLWPHKTRFGHNSRIYMLIMM